MGQLCCKYGLELVCADFEETTGSCPVTKPGG
jgi:hypothetical protein